MGTKLDKILEGLPEERQAKIKDRTSKLLAEQPTEPLLDSALEELTEQPTEEATEKEGMWVPPDQVDLFDVDDEWVVIRRDEIFVKVALALLNTRSMCALAPNGELARTWLTEVENLTEGILNAAVAFQKKGKT